MNGQGLGKAHTFLKDEIIRKDVAMLIIIRASWVCMCVLEVWGDLGMLLMGVVHSGAVSAGKQGVLRSSAASLPVLIQKLYPETNVK